MRDQDSSIGSGNGSGGHSSDEASRVVAVLAASRLRRNEKIRKALQAGTYRVDGRLVAEKMVSDAVRRLRERMR